jgi:hypothetical protein
MVILLLGRCSPSSNLGPAQTRLQCQLPTISRLFSHNDVHAKPNQRHPRALTVLLQRTLHLRAPAMHQRRISIRTMLQPPTPLATLLMSTDPRLPTLAMPAAPRARLHALTQRQHPQAQMVSTTQSKLKLAPSPSLKALRTSATLPLPTGLQLRTPPMLVAPRTFPLPLLLSARNADDTNRPRCVNFFFHGLSWQRILLASCSRTIAFSH